ncbi:MAG: HAD family phosphatase [Acidobacteriaceae bacterium]|nr:HAD family phosphatase [Acidobacteriaceae bacterium]
MIKTLIFDLGGVIVPFDFQRGYTRMEALCSYPAAEIPKRLRGTDLVTRFESGQIEARAFVEELCGVLDLRASYEEFCGIWSSIFLPHTLIPDAFIEALKSRYRLLLLSNTNAIHFEMIRENYPILRHFDHFVLSYRVGAMKPSRKIYESAIEHANCRPEECFFTDDLLPYVEGARSAGIQAVQFQGFEQLQRDLRDLGVTIQVE